MFDNFTAISYLYHAYNIKCVADGVLKRNGIGLSKLRCKLRVQRERESEGPLLIHKNIVQTFWYGIHVHLCQAAVKCTNEEDILGKLKLLSW